MPDLPFGAFALRPVEVAGAGIIKLIREFRPHVITTYDENGGYPHPDHIHSHKVATFAFEHAANPEMYPELGEPWSVSKLYYDRAFAPDRFRALHYAMIEAGYDSPYAERVAQWEADEDNQMFKWVSPHTTTTQIHCADFSRGVIRRCWPTEPRLTRKVSSSRCRSTSTLSTGHGRTTP